MIDCNISKLESQVKSTDHPDDKLRAANTPCWRLNPTQENKLLRGTTFGLLICLLLVVVGYNLRFSRQTSSDVTYGDVCMSQSCVISAANIIDRYDPTVDPCEDFYDFACGTFVKQVILPEDKSTINSMSSTNDILSLKLKLLVEEPINDTDPRSTKLVKHLFRSCMDLDSIEKRGVKPLTDFFDHLGGWPVVVGSSWNESTFDVMDTLFKIRKLGFSASYFFHFRVVTDLKNNSYRIIEFEQPKLGLPSRKYYMKGINDTDVKAYMDYMRSLATELGATNDTSYNDVIEILEFESEIASFTIPDEERRNMQELYNKFTLRELSAKIPDFPWLKITNEFLPTHMQVTEDEPVIVTVPEYYLKLTELLKRASKRLIANYLMWHVTAASASYLSKNIRDIELQYSRKMFGIDKEAPRWKDCMDLVSNELPFAVGSMYVRHFFDEDDKAEAEEMVAYIRKTFNKNLETVDWMDRGTKSRAIQKAHAIRSLVGYPKEVLNETILMDHYKGLEISDGELISNMANISVYEKNYSNGQLREKVEKEDWKLYGAAAVVNAFYSSIDNSILFPAGILQGIFFDAKRPKYMNYGAVGLVIGHEITHGFDDEGSQFNANGDLENWWHFDTRQKFLNKSQCIIAQYSNYYVPEIDLHLNGIITQGENIADNGGIKDAYHAYDQWVAEKGEEPKLPGLEYTPRQLFWISSANLWCSKERPEFLKLSVMSKFHSPPRFRINGPMSNMKEFSVDWNCPLGSNMNPTQKCHVW